MLISSLGVHDLLSYIQENDNALPKVLTRERYLEGPQFFCPLLEAMSANPINESEDSRFKNLLKILISDLRGMIIVDFEELSKDKSLSTEHLIKQYPIQETKFILSENNCKNEGMGASTPTIVKVVSESVTSSICAIEFNAHIYHEWENKPAIYSVSFTCDQWVTAVKLNLLMCNLFKLPLSSNQHRGRNLFLRPKDEEQFFDIIEFVVKPHLFASNINKPLRSLFTQVLLNSKIKRHNEIGLKILNENIYH